MNLNNKPKTYVEGYNSYHDDGACQFDNPYQANTVSWINWDAGWQEAFDNDPNQQES